MARKIGKAYCLAKGCGHVGGQVDELRGHVDKGIMAKVALGQSQDRALPFGYATPCRELGREADDSSNPHGNEGQHMYPAHNVCAATVSGNVGNVGTMSTMGNMGTVRTMRTMPSIDTRLERSASGTFQGKMRQTGLMTIEAKEYRCLLGLYYAAYDEAKNPSASTETACLQALEKCNAFYADGDVCQ